MCPMKIHSLRAALQTLPLLLVAASISRAQGRIVEPADIIVLHGRVYTENPQQPWAQAVAIYRGKIVAVGDHREIQRHRCLSAKVIKTGRTRVLPWFVG